MSSSSSYVKALLEQVDMLRVQLAEMAQELSEKDAAIVLANSKIEELKSSCMKEATVVQRVADEETGTNIAATMATRFTKGAGITVTPVSKTQKKQTLTVDGKASPDSRRDYSEQLDRLRQGQVMCWDDADANKTRPGDMFGFRHQDDRVEIHQVVEVNSTDHRLPSWSRNVGHSARNVLILTNPLYTMKWDEWVQFDWHASGPLLGTQRVANDEIRTKILNHINTKLQNSNIG